MSSIPHDCWGIVFSYTSNQRQQTGPSDRSQCALICTLFCKMIRENRSARLVSSTPIQRRHNYGVLVADSANGELRAWVGNTLERPILYIEQKGKWVGEIRPHAFPQVCFTPDEKRMAMSYGGFASVYRLSPFISERLLNASPGCVKSIAISPNGGYAALGSTEIYNTESGSQVGRLDSSAAPCDFVAFSPDGTRLVSAGPYRQIAKIWDWQRVHHPPLHTVCLQDTPTAVALSPNNRLLATTYQSRTVALLRIKDAQTIWTLHYPDLPSYLGFRNDRVVTVNTIDRMTAWEARSNADDLAMCQEEERSCVAAEEEEALPLRQIRKRTRTLSQQERL